MQITDNEKVIIRLILQRIEEGETIRGLFNMLFEKTQRHIFRLLGDPLPDKSAYIDLSTDSRKVKAINAFRETIGE
jgi:hypothetical protein